MKFGYRDRIVLLIVVIVVIFALGIFVFIKPKWEQLNTNKETRKSVAAEWQGKLNEFKLIPTLQKKIKEKYQEGLDLSANFTDEMNSIELAKFVQDKFINRIAYKSRGKALRIPAAACREEPAFRQDKDHRTSGTVSEESLFR